MGRVDPCEGEGAVWVDCVVADVCIHLCTERNCHDSVVLDFIGQCTSHGMTLGDIVSTHIWYASILCMGLADSHTSGIRQSD